MITAAIFDMDGVLADSEPLHRNCIADFGKLYGVELGDEFFANTIGKRAKDCLHMAAKEFNTDFNDEFLDHYLQYSSKYFINLRIEPSHGVIKFLEMLKANNIKTAVASSSSMNIIEILTEEIGVRRFFDKLVSGEHVPNGKPAPDIFLEACKQLNVAPNEAFVVEDSNVGVRAANSAKIKVIGYDNPSEYVQDLSTANLVIKNFDEINSDLSFLDIFTN